MVFYNLPTADNEDLRSSKLKDYKNYRAIISSYVNEAQAVFAFQFPLFSSNYTFTH